MTFFLPDETWIFTCHDYRTPGRDEFRCETTVGAQKRDNLHLNENTSEEEFVAMVKERDATLDVTRRILPSVQVNMRQHTDLPRRAMAPAI